MFKKNITLLLYNIYTFLFVFTMVNREFVLFNLDFRYVLLPLGIVLILFWLIKKEFKKFDYNDTNFIIIITLYFFALFSNIAWFFNDLEINLKKFLNEMILIINIIISLTVFWQYRKYFKKRNLNLYMVISCCVLFISFILIIFDIPLSHTFEGEELYVYEVSEYSPDNKNLFGGNYRIGGYAQDPNYASLFFVCGILATLNLNIKKIFKFPIILAFAFSLGMACSKTVLIACVASAIYIFIFYFLSGKDKVKKGLNLFFVISIFALAIILPKYNILKDELPSTITTRYAFWNSAEELFGKSPIIGNGITSFRSFFAIENWYVQCHSTYWQLLSEVGIFGFISLGILLYKLLNQNLNNKKNIFVLFVYIVWAFNFESIALQIIVYIIYLLNLKEEVEYEEG